MVCLFQGAFSLNGRLDRWWVVEKSGRETLVMSEKSGRETGLDETLPSDPWRVISYWCSRSCLEREMRLVVVLSMSSSRSKKVFYVRVPHYSPD